MRAIVLAAIAASGCSADHGNWEPAYDPGSAEPAVERFARNTTTSNREFATRRTPKAACSLCWKSPPATWNGS